MTTESFGAVDSGLTPGVVIDKRYQVIELLGEGGMGKVFRAEHVKLRRPVAVKLLHPRLTTVGSFGKRFEREAVAAARLDHPNVVGVSDFGELDDGTHYLVMELVDGITLMDVLDREDRLPLARALRIAIHVLRGLDYAHANGIVHRDIKPANIVLVDRDGDADFARVVDFGIAKIMDGEPADKLTGAGDVFGSPTYMAPEQALGQPVDHRADIYGAGICLYEMIAGVPPFWGDDKLEVLARKTSRDPPAIRQVAPEVQVPPGIEEALQRALARRPDDRIATAGELCSLLEWRYEELTGSRMPAALPFPPPPVEPRADTPAPLPVTLPDATPAPARAATPAPVSPRMSAETPVPELPPRRPRFGLIAGLAAGAVLLFALVLGLLASRGDPDAFGGDPEAERGAGKDKARPGDKPAPDRAHAGKTGVAPKPDPPPPPAPAADQPSGDPEQDALLKKYLEQLQKGRRCKDRQAAVNQLRELGDKRAIPALTKARRRMAGGILGIGRENVNSCLVKDADAAIAYLRALP